MFKLKMSVGNTIVVSCTLLTIIGGQAFADTLSGGPVNGSSEASFDAGSRAYPQTFVVDTTPSAPVIAPGRGPSNPESTRRQVQGLIREVEHPTYTRSRATQGRLQSLIQQAENPRRKRIVRRQLASNPAPRRKKSKVWKTVDYNWSKKSKSTSYVHMNPPK